MPKYAYQAINPEGATVNEVVEADSVEAVNAIVLARGYIPSKVREISGRSASVTAASLIARLSPVRSAELILFTKQLKTLLKAGVPMLNLLQVLENQNENPNLKRVIGEIARDIKEGASLTNAFGRHPKVFSPLYCGMVRAGERSGALPEVLERLTYIIEHESKVRSDIRSALQYPIIVMVLLTAAFFILLTVVIPKFIHIFVKTGVEIPLPTRICMVLYQFLVGYWYLPLGLVLVTVLGLNAYFRTDRGKLHRDALLLRAPILGTLFVKSAMSRFASIFSILQASGVSVRESMQILSGTIGNRAIAEEFQQINERLEAGRGISDPLRSARYFTPIVINMVAIGEESGNLEEMLREISGHYDVEMEYAMKKLSEAIGPLLTVGMAVVVGFFALAIFLPMWDMTKMVK